MPRLIEQLVEEQGRRWELERASKVDRGAAWPPARVITVSREPGARGGEVAQEVARRLGFSFYDREILTRIAAEAHRAEQSIRRLDERDDRTWLSDLLDPVAGIEHLSRYEYVQYLGRVVHVIAASGDSVILGRGAHLLLPPGSALRVLVQAPLAMRIAAVAAREGTTEAAARLRVAEIERERQSFLGRCFPGHQETPAHFDLCVNTGCLGVDAAAGVVCAAAGVVCAAPRATA